jgi:hypothetical protein
VHHEAKKLNITGRPPASCSDTGGPPGATGGSENDGAGYGELVSAGLAVVGVERALAATQVAVTATAATATTAPRRHVTQRRLAL